MMRNFIVLGLVFAALWPRSQASAAEESAHQVAKTQTQDSSASQYCVNIADRAADARFAWQAETLAGLKKEIDEKIAALEAKRAEYEEWLDKRNEALKQAETGIVNVYAKMRPDAAAEQLSAMEVSMAAAILRQLNARNASAILNEMNPERAAQLAKTMSDVPEKKPDDQS
jgi:flagellar motility protein MotE (MotC chaperone)